LRETLIGITFFVFIEPSSLKYFSLEIVYFILETLAQLYSRANSQFNIVASSLVSIFHFSSSTVNSTVQAVPGAAL
jgi:hypothetical protein